MTCVENVALPLRKHRGHAPSEALAEARERLAQVNMEEFGDRYPSELGDGMRKRVAIARALTLEPRYVLFDEPTTSLDLVSARRVDTLIRELSDTLGVTCVVVSHDLTSIFTIATRIVDALPGRVRLLGHPGRLPGHRPTRSSSSSSTAARNRPDGDVKCATGEVRFAINGGAHEGAIHRGQSRPPDPGGPRALAAFVLVMGRSASSPSSPSYVDFDNPGGLAVGSPVRIAGVKVGKIDEIQYRGGERQPGDPKARAAGAGQGVARKALPDKRSATIRSSTSPPKACWASSFLQIDPGSGDRPMLAEGGIVRGLDPPRLDMLLAEGFELLHTGVLVLRENRQQIWPRPSRACTTRCAAPASSSSATKTRLDHITEGAERLTDDADELVKAVRGRYVDNPQIARIIDRIDKTTEVVSRDAEPLLKDARETLSNVEQLSNKRGGARAAGQDQGGDRRHRRARAAARKPRPPMPKRSSLTSGTAKAQSARS